MTAISDKTTTFAEDYKSLIRVSDRLGVGPTLDTDDYDNTVKIRNKWGSDDAGIASCSLSMDPGLFEQQLGMLKMQMVNYGVQRLSRGASAVTTLLGNVAATVDNLDNVMALITSGGAVGTPAQVNAARELDNIIQDWAGMWPLSITDPPRDGIENVAMRFANLLKDYNAVALDLNPDRAVIPNNNCVNQVDDKFIISEIADAQQAGAGAVEWVAPPSLFKAAAALANDDTVVSNDGMQVASLSPNAGLSKLLFRLGTGAAGYTFVIGVEHTVHPTAGQTTGYTTYVDAAALTLRATPATIAEDVNNVAEQDWGCVYTYTGQTALQKDQAFRAAKYLGRRRFGPNKTTYSYSLEVETPDILRAGSQIEFFNKNAAQHGGLFVFRIDRVYSTGAGGAAKYLYQKDGSIVSRDTKLITLIGNIAGVYAPAIFKCPSTWEVLGELIRYDAYKAQRNMGTIWSSIASSYSGLNNGDTMPATDWTTERIFNLFFWLPGQPNVSKASLEILYRQLFSLILIHYKMMCGDTAYWRYITTMDNPNLKV